MHGYWDVVNRFSEEELDCIALCKRVSDLFACDGDFRTLAAEDRTGAILFARDAGCEGEDSLLAAVIGFAGGSLADGEHPAKQLWDRFQRAKGELGALLATYPADGRCGEFGAWRERQRLRVSSELGAASAVIPHSVIAFELARGCSVGCSFCGIDASKFGGAAPYDEVSSQEWRTMLLAARERFGEAIRAGFLYWGSDPLDNPDYLSFASDFFEICGVFPQVTTAIPLRNVELMRRILAYSPGRATVPHRFSILSKNVFRRALRTYSSRELLHIELVPQHTDSRIVKANAGRARAVDGPMLVTGEDGTQFLAPTTIACVTGFLVNIVDRTVKMISPTAASEQWPNGYITIDEARYDKAEDFGATLDELIARHTAPQWAPTMQINFRKDLELVRAGEGFELVGAAVVHRFRAYGELASAIEARAGNLGALLEASGTRSSSRGEEMLVVRGMFDAGLIEARPAAFA